MERVLSSWKEIASFLGKGVRTVQRWETTLGLPVHRPGGTDHHLVIARTDELAEWMFSKVDKQSRRIPTILLVDDDYELRTSTRDVLEQLGYIVLSCADGERACHLFEHGPRVDLLVTDLQVRGMSGIELAERLIARRSELPVIVFSGFNSPDDVTRDITARGWTFLAKPAGVPKLLASIRAALPAGAPETGVIMDRVAKVARQATEQSSMVLTFVPADPTSNAIGFERTKPRRSDRVA